MFSHILFAILALLYYLLRMLARAVYGSPRLYRKIRRISASLLDTLAAQYGGIVSATPLRQGWTWNLPDRSSMEITRSGRPKLTITMPFVVPRCSMTFQRMPRLPYAFMESFLGEESRIGHHPYLITASDETFILELKKEPEFVWLFEKLSKAGYSLHIGPGGLRAWKRMTLEDCSDIALYDQYRSLREFARFCSAPLSVPVHPLASTTRCAYCREEVMGGDAICCASCGTPHHQECFELNGRCSLFGCNSMQRVTAQVNVAGM